LCAVRGPGADDALAGGEYAFAAVVASTATIIDALNLMTAAAVLLHRATAAFHHHAGAVDALLDY
jgi:hypothetical protein